MEKREHWCDFHHGYFKSDVVNYVNGEIMCQACFAKTVVDQMAKNQVPIIEPEALLDMIKGMVKKLAQIKTEVEALVMLKQRINEAEKGGAEN